MSSKEKMVMFDPETEELKTIPSSDSSEEDGHGGRGGIGIRGGGSREQDIRADIHGQIERMKALCPEEDDYGIISPTFGSPRDMSYLETREKYNDIKKKLEQSVNSRPKYSQDYEGDCGKSDVDSILESFQEFNELNQSSSSFIKYENHPKFLEMYQRIVERDHKILDLETKNMELDRQIIDLQDTVNQRDKIINSKNEAVQVVQTKMRKELDEKDFDLKRVEKTLFDMEKNFGNAQDCWGKEKDRLNKEIQECRNKITHFENTNKSFEATRFELNAKNAELQEQLVSMQEESEKKLEVVNIELEELKVSLSKSNSNIGKLKTQYQAKLKQLKEKYQPFETQVVELGQKLSILEEEKGNLLLKLIDLEKSEEIELKNQKLEEEMANLIEVKDTLESKILELESTIENNEFEGKETLESRINELTLIIQNKDQDLQNALQQYEELCSKTSTSNVVSSSQFSELNQQLADKNDEFNTVVSSLNDKQNYILQLNDEVSNLKGQLRNLENMNQQISQELEVKDMEIRNLREDSNCLQNDYSESSNDLKSKISSLMNQLNDYEREISVLTQRLNEPESVPIELTKNPADLEDQILKIQDESDKKLQVANAEIEELKLNLTKSNTNIGRLKAQYMTKLKALKEKYEVEISAQKPQESDEKQAEVSQSQGAILVEKENELAAKSEEILKLQESIRSIQETFNHQANENYAKYAEDVNNLYSQLSFKTEENEQLQTRVNKLQENVVGLASDQQLIDKSNLVLELEDKLLIAQNQFDELSISKELTVTDLLNANCEIEDLKSSLAKSNSILEELKGKYQAKLKVLKDKYQPFETKVVELEQKLAEIEGEKARISLTEQFEDIKLEDQQQQSEISRNFGSIRVAETVEILEKELADKSEEILQLQESINSIQEKYNTEILQLQESINSIQEKYNSEANENYTKYAEDVSTLYTQLGLKSEENSQLQGRINELQESIDRFSQEFGSKSEQELMEKSNMIQELEDKLLTAQNNQDELSVSKQLTDADLQNANGEIEDLKNSLDKSNAILVELKTIYQTKLKALKEKYQPFESKVVELEQNLSTIETEKAKLMVEFEELKIKNQQLEEMKKLIMEREENPENVNENYQALEKELASKSEEIQRLQDTYNRQANENYTKYAEDVTNLYTQLSLKTEEVGQLQGQVNELNEHIQTFTKSMEEVTEKHLQEKSIMIKELEEKLLASQNRQDEIIACNESKESDLQSAYAEIEDLKSSLAKSNTIHEELKVKYQAKLKSIKEKYQPFEAQVVELTQKLSELENGANQTSLAEYEEIKLRNQHVEEELKSLSVVKEMCESKINDLELIIENKDRELQRALGQYQEMFTKAENADFANNQINELSQQLSEKNHEFANIISSLNEKESYILQVNDELNNARNQLNYLESSNQSITQQLEYKDEELKNIQRDHVTVKEGLESKISTLMDQFSSMEQETLTLNQKLKESQEIRQNLEGSGDRIQILEKELSDKCEELVKLQESIRSIQENYNFEASANYAKYSEDINALYNQLNFQSGENTQLQSRVNELQSRVNELSTSGQDSVQLKEQLSDKSSMIQELEDKLLTAQNQLDEFSISKEFTESDLQNANAEIEDLKNSLFKSNAILEELKVQYQNKLDHVKMSYQPYETRVAELENKLVEIETERNNLLSSLQQQYSTSTAGQIQSETLVGAGAEDPNEKVKALTAELKTLKVKNGKMLQKFKQLDTEHKKLKAKSEISLDASFEEEFMSQFKVKEEELVEKSKLLCDLQSDYGKLTEKADLFERSNAKLIEMKEHQDKYIDQLVNEKRNLESEISGLKWRLEEESESANNSNSAEVHGQGQIQQQQFIKLQQQQQQLQQQPTSVPDFSSQIQQQAASILTTDQLNEIQTLRKHNELLSNELLVLQDEISRLSQEKGFTVEEERVHVQPTGELISTERSANLTPEEARAWALLDAERVKSSILEKKIDLLHNKIAEIELSEIKCFEESINLKSLTRQLEMENFKYQREIEAYGGRGDGGGGDAKSRILNSEIFRLVEALQDRDKRCEELTAEITRLLEERDTLQLKLSNVLKKNVHLSEELKKIGGDLYKDDAESSTLDAEHPIFDKEELRMKLAELEQINYSINIDLRREREARRIVQEQLFFSQSSRIYKDRFRDVSSSSRRTPSPSFSGPSTSSPSKVPLTPQSQQVQKQAVIPATPSFIPTINPDLPFTPNPISTVPWSGETFEFDQSLSVQTQHQSSQQHQHSPNPNVTTSIPVVDI